MRPAGHFVQPVEASRAYANQGVMFTGRYRLPEEYVPASHSTHAMDASKALYVPAGQSVQFELTPGLMRPAEHGMHDADMLFDAFPASQFRHSMDPATACVPARHIRQK